MQKIVIFALALLYTGSSFSIPDGLSEQKLFKKAKECTIRIEQEDRLTQFRQDPQHPMRRFHPVMVKNWILTGKVQATESIRTSPDELKKSLEKILNRTIEKERKKRFFEVNAPISTPAIMGTGLLFLELKQQNLSSAKFAETRSFSILSSLPILYKSIVHPTYKARTKPTSLIKKNEQERQTKELTSKCLEVDQLISDF